MPATIPGVDSSQSFQAHAREYFSRLWDTDLAEGAVKVGGRVPWKFDLVSSDGRYVGDAKWYKNIPVPAAKWQAIAEYLWLLQKVEAERVFLVFGRDPEVAERYLKRVGPLTPPVECYFLDGDGHRLLWVG